MPNPKPTAVLPRNAEFALEVLVALAEVGDVADATGETVPPGTDVLPDVDVTDAGNAVEVGADVDWPAWGAAVPSWADSSTAAVSVVVVTAPLAVTAQTAVVPANSHSSFNVNVNWDSV